MNRWERKAERTRVKIMALRNKRRRFMQIAAGARPTPWEWFLSWW